MCRQCRDKSMASCCSSVPYFVTADNEQYAVSSWDSDDLLMYESDDASEHVLTKCLSMMTDTADSLSSGPSSLSARDPSCPVLNDCMWSAGMLPPDLKVAARTSPSHDDCVSPTADLDTGGVCTAVDPSLVSPCPLTSSPGARHVTPTDTGRLRLHQRH